MLLSPSLDIVASFHRVYKRFLDSVVYDHESFSIMSFISNLSEPGGAKLGSNHRYRKAKIDCLSFVYVPATSAAHNILLFIFFFAAAVYSTNEENMRC
jgi:hypothetical protein